MAFSSAAPLEKWSPTVVSQPNRVRSMMPRAKHGWWCCLHGKVWPEKKGPQLTGCVMCHHHVIGIQMGLPLFYSIQSAFLIISGHFNSFSQRQSSLPLPGFGIGPKLSAMVGGMMRASGQRFFAKTSNQALGGSLGITRSM